MDDRFGDFQRSLISGVTSLNRCIGHRGTVYAIHIFQRPGILCSFRCHNVNCNFTLVVWLNVHTIHKFLVPYFWTAEDILSRRCCYRLHVISFRHLYRKRETTTGMWICTAGVIHIAHCYLRVCAAEGNFCLPSLSFCQHYCKRTVTANIRNRIRTVRIGLEGTPPEKKDANLITPGDNAKRHIASLFHFKAGPHILIAYKDRGICVWNTKRKGEFVKCFLLLAAVCLWNLGGFFRFHCNVNIIAVIHGL